MDAGHAQVGEGARQVLRVLLRGLEFDGQFLVLLHHRADDKDLPPLTDELADKAVEARPVALVHGEGVDLLPPGGQLVDDRHVEVAVNDQGEGAGDGRRGHDQHVGLLPLADQGRALPDAEAVLLVGHDEAQLFIFHILTEQGVGADDEVELARLEGRLDLALLLRGHGAGQPPNAKPQRPEQFRQRVGVLFGQDLGRRHEGGHIAVFKTVVDQRRRDEGLAAAHVALHQPVHDRAGVHVGDGLLHRAALRPGGGEGESRPEAAEITLLHADARVLRPLAPHPAEGAGEDEELLKDEPPPGQIERFKVSGKVDVFKGVAGLRKLAALPHVVRQHVRQLVETGVETLPDALEHGALIEPRRHAVDRDDAPGDLPLAVGLFVDGVDHAAPQTVGLDPAEEDIGLPAAEVVFGVGLVEEGDVEHGALVHGAELDEVETPADTGQPRRVGHHGLHADALSVQREGDGLYGAAVLVFPRKKRNKVTQRKDAELIQRLRLFLSYALEVAYVGIQVRHGLFHIAKRVVGVGEGELLDQPLGADNLVVGVDEHHVKPAVLPPVAEGLALTQYEHRGRQAVGQRPVLADDGDGLEGVVDGPAGLGVDEVVIGLAVLDEEALVGAGGDHGGLAHGEDADKARGVVRILHGDVPVRPVRLETEGLDVTAEGDDAARHADVAHGADGVVGGAALGHRAEADLRPGGEGHGVGAGAREAGQRHLVVGAADEILPQLFIRGHVVAAAVEAPALDNGVDGQVERAAGLLVDRVGGREHVRHLAGNGDVAAVCVVDGVGGAGLNVGVEHVVHGEDDALRRVEAALGVLAVGRERHDRVHGEDLPLAHLRLAAGRKSQCHGKAEQQEQHSFQGGDMFHRTVSLSLRQNPAGKTENSTCHRWESLL